MPSLLDRDRTEAREKAYPELAGNFCSALAEVALKTYVDGTTKYVHAVQELLKLPDVHFAIRQAIIAAGGKPEEVGYGGILPAIMFSAMRAPELRAKWGGSLVVSESNHASEQNLTTVENETKINAGGIFWNAADRLKVTHTSKSEQSRDTDFRSKWDFEFQWAPGQADEGSALIRELAANASKSVAGYNHGAMEHQLEQKKKELNGEIASPQDVSGFVAQTDRPNGAGAGAGGGFEDDLGGGPPAGGGAPAGGADDGFGGLDDGGANGAQAGQGAAAGDGGLGN